MTVSCKRLVENDMAAIPHKDASEVLITRNFQGRSDVQKVIISSKTN